jgi:hypothetical protein
MPLNNKCGATGVAQSHAAPTSVRAVLSNETYFGDGKPQWLESRNQHPCQTAEEAEIERKRLIKRLRRFGKHNAAALAVADRIEGCAVHRRCMSGACPECARAWQRWFVEATVAFLLEETDRLSGGSTILSPIHCDGSIEPEELAIGPVSSLAHTVVNALTSTGTEVAVLGLDISFNEHQAGGFDPHWLAHFRALVPRRLPKSTLAELRQHFPADDRIRKPLKVARFDGEPAGIAYTMKPGFERRQSYQQVKQTSDGTRECQNTRGRPLRGSDTVELMVFLERLGLRKRLILLGAGLVRSTDGTVRIRSIRPSRGLQWPKQSMVTTAHETKIV